MLTEGGREIARIDDALDILIANGPYQGGVKLADEAHPESRDLVIRIVKGGRKTNLLRTWARPALNNRTADFTEIIRASDVVIETDPPYYVSIDGEVADPHPGPRLGRKPGAIADGAAGARGGVVAIG